MTRLLLLAFLAGVITAEEVPHTEGRDEILALVSRIERDEADGLAQRVRVARRELLAGHAHQLFPPLASTAGEADVAPLVSVLGWHRQQVSRWETGLRERLEEMEGREARARLERAVTQLAEGRTTQREYEFALETVAQWHHGTRAADHALAELAARALDRGDAPAAVAWSEALLGGVDVTELATRHRGDTLRWGAALRRAGLVTRFETLLAKLTEATEPGSERARGRLLRKLGRLALRPGMTPGPAAVAGQSSGVMEAPGSVSMAGIELTWEAELGRQVLSEGDRRRWRRVMRDAALRADPPVPVLGGGRIWVAGDRTLVDIDLVTGARRDRESQQRAASAKATTGEGVFCVAPSEVPFVRAGERERRRRVVQQREPASGSWDLVRLEPRSGEILWRHVVDPELSIAGNVTMAGGHVLVSAVSREDGLEAHLLALDPGSGELRWTRLVAVGGKLPFANSWGRSGTAVSPGQPLLSAQGSHVFVDTARGLLSCLDAVSGSFLWARTYARRAQPVRPGEGASIPLVAEGRLLALPADGASLLAIDIVDGELLWERRREEYRTLLGVQGGLVYVGGPECAGFDLESGALREHLTLPWGRHAGRGLLTRECLLVSSPDHLFRIGLEDFAVEGEWAWPTGGEAHSLLLTEEGTLLSLSPVKIQCFHLLPPPASAAEGR